MVTSRERGASKELTSRRRRRRRRRRKKEGGKTQTQELGEVWIFVLMLHICACFGMGAVAEGED